MSSREVSETAHLESNWVFCAHRSPVRGAHIGFRFVALQFEVPHHFIKKVSRGAAEFDRRSIPRKKNRKKRLVLAAGQVCTTPTKPDL
jgi:hypothetical protein